MEDRFKRCAEIYNDYNITNIRTQRGFINIKNASLVWNLNLIKLQNQIANGLTFL